MWKTAELQRIAIHENNNQIEIQPFIPKSQIIKSPRVLSEEERRAGRRRQQQGYPARKRGEKAAESQTIATDDESYSQNIVDLSRRDYERYILPV